MTVGAEREEPGERSELDVAEDELVEMVDLKRHVAAAAAFASCGCTLEHLVAQTPPWPPASAAVLVASA